MCAIAGIFQLDRPLTADLRQAARAMTVIGILLATAACGTADPATVKADAIQRGDALMVKQNHGEAVAAYLLAVEIDPRDGDLRLRLAKAHQSAHQWEDASRQFITAAELLPGNWDLQLEAVRWMLLLFRYSDAAHRSSALLKSKPDDPELLVLLGTAKARLRYFDMGIAEIELALRHGASFDDAQKRLRSNRSDADDRDAENPLFHYHLGIAR
jgi:tetratricopeptide (TPR) repeat protein